MSCCYCWLAVIPILLLHLRAKSNGCVNTLKFTSVVTGCLITVKKLYLTT
ncbi:putative secreted protein (plasmid) [Pantoea agglomerans]|nr:putative secreted protein [Pantoea agglomerans]